MSPETSKTRFVYTKLGLSTMQTIKKHFVQFCVVLLKGVALFEELLFITKQLLKVFDPPGQISV